MCTFLNVSTWAHIVAHMPPALYGLQLLFMMNTSVCLKDNLLQPLSHCYTLNDIIQKENNFFFICFYFNSVSACALAVPWLISKALEIVCWMIAAAKHS